MIIKLSEYDKRTLQRLEESLWLETTRFDALYMDKVLAEDFFEFGRSGRVYQREAIISGPREPIEAVIPLPDFRVRALGEDIAQTIYNSQATSDGIVEKGRRSSIWSRSPDGWLLRFHQGTPYDEDPL